MRGPTGSVRGVPEPEATAKIYEVVEKLVTESGDLQFSRSRARELFREAGVGEELIDAYLFSLQRSVPGVEYLEHDTYLLPDDWDTAVRFRTARFSIPKVDVLVARKLLDVVSDVDELKEIRARLEAGLSAEGVL